MIKKIAVKGEKASFVSSFEVNKVTPFTVSNLIEWSSDKTGTVYQDFSTLTLNNAKVLFAIGDLVFLREDGKCIELGGCRLEIADCKLWAKNERKQ